MTILGEKWICKRCGKYYYIGKGAGVMMGTRCPFCLGDRSVGKYIKDVRIIV